MSLLGYVWIWYLLDSSQISLITQQTVEDGTTPCCQSSPGGWETSAHRPHCQNKERTINQRWHWLCFAFPMEFKTLILGSFLRSAGSCCQRSTSWAGLWNTPGLVRGMPLITAYNSYGIYTEVASRVANNFVMRFHGFVAPKVQCITMKVSAMASSLMLMVVPALISTRKLLLPECKYCVSRIMACLYWPSSAVDAALKTRGETWPSKRTKTRRMHSSKASSLAKTQNLLLGLLSVIYQRLY